MQIENIDVELIRANPYQTRTREDADHIAVLAEDIAARGLLQIPIARPCGSNAYELAFGHSRLAAWKIAHPGVAFPLIVRQLTDLEMSDFAAAENAKRKNLSAIETALAIQRRVSDFGLTQLEAAHPFGYKSQGSVSNLLRLLQLPEPIRAQVDRGELSEGVARSLIPVARIAPQKAIDIAEHVQTIDPKDRASAVATQLETDMKKIAKSLYNVAWPLDYPQSYMSVALCKVKDAQGELIETIPACQGCDYRIDAKYTPYCARVACFDLKAQLWSEAEAARVAGEKKIKVSHPDESVTPLLESTSTYGDDEIAQAALELGHKSLRVMPLNTPKENYLCKQILGSGVVGLGTVDMQALLEALPEDTAEQLRDEQAEDAEEKKSAALDPKARAEAERKRAEQERKQADKAAKQHRAQVRENVEVDRLVEAGAKQLAAILPSNYLVDMLCKVADQYGDLKYADTLTDLLKHQMDDKKFAAMHYLLANAEELASEYSKLTVEQTRERLIDFARSFKVKLAKDWDAKDLTPIRFSDVGFDCIDCGIDAQTNWRGDQRVLSSEEISRGWAYESEGMNLRCPECNAKWFEQKKIEFGKAKPGKAQDAKKTKTTKRK